MYIRIITVNQKIPAWIETGFNEYLQRFPSGSLQLIEIPLENRKNTNAKEKEGKKILAFIKPSNHVVVLDEKGVIWSTETFAQKLGEWRDHGLHVDFIIGGPDGLSNECYQRANDKWSLSKLTFPHHLVRVLLIEQLYRAHTILIDHPYHRQ